MRLDETADPTLERTVRTSHVVDGCARMAGRPFCLSPVPRFLLCILCAFALSAIAAIKTSDASLGQTVFGQADPATGLAISLRVPDEKPELLDPETGALILTLTNKGNETWHYGRGGYESGLEIEILDGQNNRLPPEREARGREYNHFRRQVTLKPGETDTHTLVLGQRFPLAAGTTYQVKIVWNSYAFRAPITHETRPKQAVPFRLEAGPISFTPRARPL
jgi:hypothetical protein